MKIVEDSEEKLLQKHDLLLEDDSEITLVTMKDNCDHNLVIGLGSTTTVTIALSTDDITKLIEGLTKMYALDCKLTN